MLIMYKEALEMLQSMFGAPWPHATLDAVLHHHGVHRRDSFKSRRP